MMRNLVIKWLEQRQVKEGGRKRQTLAIGGKGKTKKEGKWEVVYRERGGHRGRRQGPAKGRKQMKCSKWAMGDTIEKMLRRRKKKSHMEQTTRKKEDRGVRIVSHNIRGGIGTGTKWPEIVEYLEKEKPEVLMVQEAKIRADDMERKMVPKEYHCWSSSMEMQGGIRQRGVMTLVHKSLATRVRKEDVIKDKEGRHLVVPVATLEKGQTLWLINVYAPASQSKKGQGGQKRQREREIDQEEIDKEEEREEIELRREKTRFYTETLGRLTEEIGKARTPRDVIIVCMDARIW